MKHETKPLSNSYALMLCLGWQGGTIYQVCDSTGLTVPEIMALDTTKIHCGDELTAYNAGYSWVCDYGVTPRNRPPVPKEYLKNCPFFCGAIDAMKRSV